MSWFPSLSLYGASLERGRVGDRTLTKDHGWPMMKTLKKERDELWIRKGWGSYDTSFFKLDLKHESRLTYANWVFPFYPKKLICLNDNSKKLIIGQERMGVMKDYANLSSSILDINLVSQVFRSKIWVGLKFPPFVAIIHPLLSLSALLPHVAIPFPKALKFSCGRL